MFPPSLIVSAGCLLLACVCTTTVADNSHMGGQCSGQLLHNQKASTKSDSSEASFVVAYGGGPGVEISCITTQDLSQDNTTVSTLVAGGPGTRYVVLKVAAKDDKDAEFEVNVFGNNNDDDNALSKRVKRADGSSTTEKPRNKNPIIAASDDVGKIVKQLRFMATQLEAIQKLMLFLSNPFAPAPDSS